MNEPPKHSNELSVLYRDWDMNAFFSFSVSCANTFFESFLRKQNAAKCLKLALYRLPGIKTKPEPKAISPCACFILLWS